MRPVQAELAAALRRHAIREGEFTLASGRTSNWYLDGRRLTFRGDALDLVGRAVVEALDAAGVDTFDSVGGLELGAVPVALAVARESGTRAFAVRKDAKVHGVGGRIAGPLEAGDRVVVVEDTATTGASLLAALDAVVASDLDCRVVGVSLLLDRGGTLAAELERRGVTYAPVLGAPDLGYPYGS